MIEENLHNEAGIRRFLLGEMSESERRAFEEQFIADENLFEQARVGEDELIESYVREILTSDEKEKFERNFLSTEKRRQRVAFTRTMLDKLSDRKEIVTANDIETTEETLSVWDSIANFFKTPKLVFGAAFALLILVFGFWFLVFRFSNDSYELARQITPTPAIQNTTQNQNANVKTNQDVSANLNLNVAETNPVDKNASPNTNRETPTNRNQNSDARKPNSVRVAPVLALFAGMRRDGGKMPQLNLPKNASGATLQLNLESQDYKIYQVEIVDPDGNLVFQNNRLKARNSKINLFVPAKKLRRGDYMIKVSAVSPNEENESVADFSFRVNRK